MKYDEPLTEQERIALEILQTARLETDDDYIALAKLIDNAIHDENVAPTSGEP